MHFSSEDMQKETSHLSLFLSSTEPSFCLTEVNGKFLFTPVTPGFWPIQLRIVSESPPVKGIVKKLFKGTLTRRQKSIHSGCLL